MNNSLLLAAQVGNMNMAGNFRESEILKTLPTREKCKQIITWLCVDDNTSKTKVNKTDSYDDQKIRKHPTHCIYRDKTEFLCGCTQSKSYKQICNSTSNCAHYKDDRK